MSLKDAVISLTTLIISATALLAVLKLTVAESMSWWVVCLPLYAPVFTCVMAAVVELARMFRKRN